MNEIINIKFSRDEALVLFKCLIAVLSFAVTLDDALETKQDFGEIQRIKGKIYNAAMNERKQMEPGPVEGVQIPEVLRAYERQMVQSFPGPVQE